MFSSGPIWNKFTALRYANIYVSRTYFAFVLSLFICFTLLFQNCNLSFLCLHSLLNSNIDILTCFLLIKNKKKLI
jgi:hypothetical protein